MPSLLKTAALGLALLGEALAKPRPAADYKSAFYFYRSKHDGDSIVAMALADDGTLLNDTAHVSVTSTKGFGLQSQATYVGAESFTNGPLNSADCIEVYNNYLFTVNSGSNTVVMFEIDPLDPLRLTMVGQPASSLGSSPTSLNYSPKLNMLCTLNGGTLNGVACFHVDAKLGLIPDGVGLRDTGVNATTPPVHKGVYYSGSDVRFNPEQDYILVVFKGAFLPEYAVAPMFVFPVENGLVSTKSYDASNEMLKYAWGFRYDMKNTTNFYITEATYGGSLVHIDPVTYKTTIINSNYDEVAYIGSCWTVYNETTETFYDVITLQPTFLAIDAKTGDITREYSFADSPYAEYVGGQDAVLFNNKIYTPQALYNNIIVLDVVTGETDFVQWATPEDQAFWQGAAVYDGTHN